MTQLQHSTQAQHIKHRQAVDERWLQSRGAAPAVLWLHTGGKMHQSTYSSSTQHRKRQAGRRGTDTRQMIVNDVRCKACRDLFMHFWQKQQNDQGKKKEVCGAVTSFVGPERSHHSVLTAKGSSFPPVPSLLGTEFLKAWLLATKNSLSAEGKADKSVPWQLPLERT